MPYVTVRQPTVYRREEQITIDDLLFCDAVQPYNPDKHISAPPGAKTGTVTRIIQNTEKLADYERINALIERLEKFCNDHKDLFLEDMSPLYHRFKIPKKSGGLRPIAAPNPVLMQALQELRFIFENDFGALYHTAAFAYVKGRSTVDSIRKHQQNESKWFLKLDVHNFFGSITFDWTYQTLSKIYPFSEVVKYAPGATALKKALSLCFLDGGLPQGTPISPMLTNLLMIPIEHRIFNELSKRGFVYTQYADDILISHRQSFDAKEIEDYVMGVLKAFDAPFHLNSEKTRYGSSAGRNWNLGLMLNKDNQITVGYREKKLFKAMLNNFILDTKNHVPWPLDDVRHLQGNISYYLMVEEPYFRHVIQEFEKKYGVNLKVMMKHALNPN